MNFLRYQKIRFWLLMAMPFFLVFEIVMLNVTWSPHPSTATFVFIGLLFLWFFCLFAVIPFSYGITTTARGRLNGLFLPRSINIFR